MTKRRTKSLSGTRSTAQPFLAHLHELRRRLFRIAVSVIVGAVGAYICEHQVVAALLKPAGNQQFIYTSPGGGVDFVFRVGLYIGIIVSIPVIMYQFLKFIEPLLRKTSNRFVMKISLASGVLAIVGLVFGYFIGLPNALSFLLHQFTTAQIKPLVTIQAYMAFVMMYMVSSALLLQAPLILLFINRIKPLKPSSLLKQERWVILGAFVGAFIMNPTPNLIAQCLVAVPIIVAYHVGVGLVWYINRKSRRPGYVQQLIEHDLEVQRQRLQVLQSAFSLVGHSELVPARQEVQTAPVMTQQFQQSPGRSTPDSRFMAPRRFIT